MCLSCERRGLECIYDRVEGSGGGGGGSNHPANAGQSAASTSSGDHNDGTLSVSKEPKESRQRRMEELELLHFYITETGPSIAFDKMSSYDMFVKAIPRLALKSDALLYSLYSFTYLHQSKTTGGDEPSTPSKLDAAAAREGYQLYLELAFRHHRDELKLLSRETADKLWMTANFMRLNAFVVLSERSLEPYTPPLDWLRITESHTPLYLAVFSAAGDDRTSQVAKLTNSTPVAKDSEKRKGTMQDVAMQRVLYAPCEVEGSDESDPDLWEDGLRQAYESALGYIGGTIELIRKNSPLGLVGRQMLLFPLIVDTRFIELVGESRPRALVALAHYFALFVILESFWYIDQTGRREVEAIAAHLPPHWKPLMEWPLKVINEGISYTPIAAP